MLGRAPFVGFIPVHDAAVARAFYEGVLGLEVLTTRRSHSSSTPTAPGEDHAGRRVRGAAVHGCRVEGVRHRRRRAASSPTEERVAFRASTGWSRTISAWDRAERRPSRLVHRSRRQHALAHRIRRRVCVGDDDTAAVEGGADHVAAGSPDPRRHRGSRGGAHPCRASAGRAGPSRDPGTLDGTQVDAVDHAFTDTVRSVITWLNRGTLHLVAASDYWWLATRSPAAARSPRTSAGCARKAWLRASNARHRRHPPGRQRRRAADARRTATCPHQRPRTDSGPGVGAPLIATSLHHDLVRGPMPGREHAFVSATAWLGAAAASARARRRARVSRAVTLAGHAPPGPRTSRSGAVYRSRIHGARSSTPDLTTAARKPRRSPRPHCSVRSTRCCTGGRRRAPFVGEHKGVVTTNGIFRPIALVDGKAVALWSLASGGAHDHPARTTDAASRAAPWNATPPMCGASSHCRLAMSGSHAAHRLGWITGPRLTTVDVQHNSRDERRLLQIEDSSTTSLIRPNPAQRMEFREAFIGRRVVDRVLDHSKGDSIDPNVTRRVLNRQ